MRTNNFLRSWPPYLLSAVRLLAILCLMLSSFSAYAQDGEAGPPSGNGIQPIWYFDNPSCGDFDPNYNELKIEPVADGTFTYGNLQVTIDVYTTENGQAFDWTSNRGVDAVFVKAGNNGNLYNYDEETSDTFLHGPVNPENNMFYGLSHISFCFDYELDVSKTAEGTFDRTINWELEKSVDPAAHNGFIGDSFSSTWTVVATKHVMEDNYQVAGVITINNPAPFDVDFNVSDLIDGSIEPLVTCPSYTVGALGTVECTYVATEFEGIDGTQESNEAIVVSHTPGVFSGSDTAPITFTAVVSGDESITVDDDRNGGPDGNSISDTTSWSYDETFTCSTIEDDYTNGSDSDSYPNTATATGDNTDLSSDANVIVDCYLPSADKSADPYYTREYSWEISKSVDDNSHSGFIDDTFLSNYTVSVDQTVSEYGFSVSGTITVNNPNPLADLTVSIADSVGGIPATLDCGGTLTVPAGENASCGYSASLGGKVDGTNTATVTIPNQYTITAAKDYVFGEPTNIVGDESINITDTQPDSTAPWTANGDDSWSYPGDFACPSDKTRYIDSSYTYEEPNTAKIIETGDTAEANVTVSCYVPIVTKTAEASYDETHTWELSKWVEPTSQSGYPGEQLDWTWHVDVSESSEDSNFGVTGTIYIQNPNPDAAMIVDVSDMLNDGTSATVDCGGDASRLQVPANATGTCEYSASPNDASATLNIAKALLNGFEFTGTKSVSFIVDMIGGTATVTDEQIGLDETLIAGQGPWNYTGDNWHICSTTGSDYSEDGTYSETLTNTASLTSSSGQSIQADANTTYTCEAGFVDLLKLTNGLVDPTKDWMFQLLSGPDGFGGTAIATNSTLNDPDGILDFGQPPLSPAQTYTICELDVPAGYSTLWQIDTDGDGTGDVTIIPYNPNANDDPSEDLGNRCVDFGAGTAYLVVVGETLHYIIDNQEPGGAPRTPGYWKNWNRCTKGGQQYTADVNGGWSEGYWLLEDVLDPGIGGGITWDDILDDDFEFPITSCAVAVDLLDKREIGDPEVVGDGKKAASDPLHNLATHLLAAQLNFGAGACTTQDVLDAALAAETLLDEYNFDGNEHDRLKKNARNARLANDLASYLDGYNNGEFCGDGTE